MTQLHQSQSVGQGSSLIELARQFPDITISVKLSDLMTANKALVDGAKLELLNAVQDASYDTTITRQEACEILGKSDRSLQRWQTNGSLIGELNGGTYMYLKSVVTAYRDKLIADKRIKR